MGECVTTSTKGFCLQIQCIEMKMRKYGIKNQNRRTTTTATSPTTESERKNFRKSNNNRYSIERDFCSVCLPEVFFFLPSFPKYNICAWWCWSYTLCIQLIVYFRFTFSLVKLKCMWIHTYIWRRATEKKEPK